MAGLPLRPRPDRASPESLERAERVARERELFHGHQGLHLLGRGVEDVGGRPGHEGGGGGGSRHHGGGGNPLSAPPAKPTSSPPWRGNTAQLVLARSEHCHSASKLTPTERVTVQPEWLGCWITNIATVGNGGFHLGEMAGLSPGVRYGEPPSNETGVVNPSLLRQAFTLALWLSALRLSRFCGVEVDKPVFRSLGGGSGLHPPR